LPSGYVLNCNCCPESLWCSRSMLQGKWSCIGLAQPRARGANPRTVLTPCGAAPCPRRLWHCARFRARPVPGGQGLCAVPQTRPKQAAGAARLLHRRACSGAKLALADAGCQSVQNLLPDTGSHRALKLGRCQTRNRYDQFGVRDCGRELRGHVSLRALDLIAQIEPLRRPDWRRHRSGPSEISMLGQGDAVPVKVGLGAFQGVLVRWRQSAQAHDYGWCPRERQGVSVKAEAMNPNRMALAMSGHRRDARSSPRCAIFGWGSTEQHA